MIDPSQNPGPFELESTQLGALPVIDRFLERMDLPGILGRWLPGADARTTLPVAAVIGVLVRNLAVEREPLYGLAGWARRFEPGLLGLAPAGRASYSTTTASAAPSTSCSMLIAGRC
jgi:hypothetical protein